mmetsp:Transcript_104551/g.239631  ORF Transcript_104551/g.239631 Transcript_104551/m.239631 type:complete len:294 (+) Transcript_104551:3-884(+)
MIEYEGVSGVAVAGNQAQEGYDAAVQQQIWVFKENLQRRASAFFAASSDIATISRLTTGFTPVVLLHSHLYLREDPTLRYAPEISAARRLLVWRGAVPAVVPIAGLLRQFVAASTAPITIHTMPKDRFLPMAEVLTYHLALLIPPMFHLMALTELEAAGMPTVVPTVEASTDFHDAVPDHLGFRGRVTAGWPPPGPAHPFSLERVVSRAVQLKGGVRDQPLHLPRQMYWSQQLAAWVDLPGVLRFRSLAEVVWLAVSEDLDQVSRRMRQASSARAELHIQHFAAAVGRVQSQL